MEPLSTASLQQQQQQQMHTIANLSSTAGSSNSNFGHPLAPDESRIQCPNCDKKLHRFEVATHCEQEMQRLKEHQQTTQHLTESHDLEENGQAGEEHSNVCNGQSTSEKRKPWTVFQRVQRNRQSRLKQRTRKRPAAVEHPCPVCNLTFPQDEIQQHAEACLRRSNRTANGRSNSDEHSSNDDDDGGVGGGGEEYEEYEWAGQKRIRASSLLQGGYAAIGIGQVLTNGGSSTSSSSNRHNGHQDVDDDEEDLNVDEDDTQIYGPAQYGENDVIPSHILNENESDVTSYMRRLITGSSTSSSSQLSSNLALINNENLNINPIVGSHNDVPVESSSSKECSQITAGDPTSAQYQQIIDSLKAKLRHYEQQHVPGKYKCLICLDDYRNPAISVACWHVHCEQCWLRSLGARKLCPQCNLITTPKDLRRIYM